MPDALSPEDLRMFRDAAQQAQATAMDAQRAHQVHQQAVGAYQFVTKMLAERYGLQHGGGWHPETGEIQRPGQAEEPPVKARKK